MDQLHKLRDRKEWARSKAPAISARLRALDSKPLGQLELLKSLRKSAFEIGIEEMLVIALTDVHSKILPIDSLLLLKHLAARFPDEKLETSPAMIQIVEAAISRLHEKFGSEALKIEENASVGFKARTLVLEVNKGRLKALALASDLLSDRDRRFQVASKPPEKKKIPEGPNVEEALLDRPSFVQSKDIEVGEAALKIIHTLSHKQRMFHEKIKSHGNVPFHEICFSFTREECKKINPACTKLHFRLILSPNADVSQGECSFLNTCHKMNTCKFVHYGYDQESLEIIKKLTSKPAKYPLMPQIPKQWIRCDVRNFDFSVIGKFSVIMADPPWEIHQQLPYGTMTDNEMRGLNLQELTDDGYIFLWVTGRAMELGRECLKIWGYERVDEIIWLKINQAEKIIRTGRTGHWLNHSKEHCIVGVKGKPKFHIGFDCDVVVAGVRETSRKPDELYTMIERLAPGARKLEIFGREHNLQEGWMTLGNQLPDYHIVEKDVMERFKKRYPNGVTEVKSTAATAPPSEMSRSDSDLFSMDD